MKNSQPIVNWVKLLVPVKAVEELKIPSPSNFTQMKVVNHLMKHSTILKITSVL